MSFAPPPPPVSGVYEGVLDRDKGGSPPTPTDPSPLLSLASLGFDEVESGSLFSGEGDASFIPGTGGEGLLPAFDGPGLPSPFWLRRKQIIA